MYERISDQEMGLCPPPVALSPRTPAKQQSASGVGVPHRVRRYRSGRPPFSSPGVRRSRRRMEGFLIRECDPIIPGQRWLHELQLISNQPVMWWKNEFGREKTRLDTPAVVDFVAHFFYPWVVDFFTEVKLGFPHSAR